MNHLYLTICCMGVLASCQSYSEKSVNLSQDSEQWLALSQELCPASLTNQDMQQIALLLNPKLRQVRLKYAKSTAIAEWSGLWEDPSLSFNAIRVLEEHLTNGGVSAGFTLPVTGIPAISERIAEQYKEADYWTVRAQERELLKQCEILRQKIFVKRDQLQCQRQRFASCQQELKHMESFFRLGELSFAELQIAKQRAFNLSEEGRKFEADLLDLNLSLLALMGLHPSCAPLSIGGSLTDGIPTAKPVVAVEQLMEYPTLLAQSAKMAASNQELKREIRRQFPELGISPAWEHEEGNTKLGIGLSIPIPAWNRNREMIVAARAERELAADAFISEFRRLLTEAETLRQQQSLALEHCHKEHARYIALKKDLAIQQQLYDLGELGFAELAEWRHQLYQAKLAYDDCLSKLLIIQVQLISLNPFNIL